MKTIFRLWLLGLGLLAGGPASGGTSPPLPWPDDAAPAESVLQKSGRLIRESAGAIPAGAQPGAGSEEANRAAADHRDVVVLEPMIINQPRTPALPPALHEAPVRQFLRTGTIWERVGRKFTTKVGASGDQGIFFRLSW